MVRPLTKGKENSDCSDGQYEQMSKDYKVNTSFEYKIKPGNEEHPIP